MDWKLKIDFKNIIIGRDPCMYGGMLLSVYIMISWSSRVRSGILNQLITFKNSTWLFHGSMSLHIKGHRHLPVSRNFHCISINWNVNVAVINESYFIPSVTFTSIKLENWIFKNVYMFRMILHPSSVQVTEHTSGCDINIRKIQN